MFLLWGILLLRSYLWPKVNIEIVLENWTDNYVHFKAWSEERDLDINRKLIVSGYVIDPIGENHSKKKTEFEYIIDGDDLKVGFQAKEFIAKADLSYEEIGARGFLFFKTFIFSFIGGGRKRIRYIFSTVGRKPLSLKKYLTMLYQYKKNNLIPKDEP